MFEVTNMLHEVSEELETDKTGRIHFDDLVRLYINHRPTTGISEAILKEAYLTFAEEDSQDSLESTNPVIIVTNFLAVLEGTGEMFNRTETTNYLNALLSKNGGIDEKKIIYSLPDVMLIIFPT
ncbi:hypothetical protein AAG570_000451 [Ranatra chinensis]|uniref:Uncharacterized protein n=1 Tax=Ranatra chinensis TaxID=642074 RepID=A0ABD0YX39_9HEMI